MKEVKIKFKIKSVNKNDKDWIRNFIVRKWGSEKIIIHGKIFYPSALPGFIVYKKNNYLGLVTYIIKKNILEIITIDAVVYRKGIGTVLLKAVEKVARKRKCKRIRVVTTNDNVDALRFWQKRGFLIKTVYPNAISLSRKLKPEIPLIGNYGILVKDEIKLEKFIR